MDPNKYPLKRTLGIITFALLLYWGLQHPNQVAVLLSTLFALVSPFLIGCAIAFIINVLLRPVEQTWDRLWAKQSTPIQQKLKRPVCLVFSTVVIAGGIFALFFIVIPALKDSVESFAAMLPQHLATLEGWWADLSALLSQYGVVLPAFTLDLERLYTAVLNFLTNYGQTLMDTTIGVTTSIFSAAVNFVLALVFSLYVLAQKETLSRQVTKTMQALLPEKKATWLMDLAALTNKTFSNFITGQLTEAVILGSLCFVGMVLFKMPYASVVSVLIGFTALIPIFGAFIGIIVGAFLILLISPIKAFWFVIFILVLQQIEGNLVYPRVVGKSVGLPGIWVLAAVTVGGNAFGLVGMLLSVPVCSVLYALLRQLVNGCLERKGLDK